MLIHRRNLETFNIKKIILQRKILWLCTRINASMKLEILRTKSIFDDINKHLNTKIRINKYKLLYMLYQRLQRNYKQFLNDFKNNKSHKLYTFKLYI